MDIRILRTQAAATYCGLSPSTLEKMRSRGDGPRFVRLPAKSVGYDLADLDAWITARKAASQSATDDAK